MVKFVLTIAVFYLFLAFNLYAGQEEKNKILGLIDDYVPTQEDWNQKLYDSIRYSEDGKTQYFNLEQIKLSLSNGANPNWIIHNERGDRSILDYCVICLCLGLSDNPNAIKRGTKALEMLFEQGAKLQYCDGGILYSPIADGKYDVVKMLLEKGASATFFPKDIGSTPIELATENGYDEIIDLLVSYGAKRLSKEDAVQARFVNAAGHGSVDELKVLLKEGAEINRPNNQGETALLNALDVAAYYYEYGYLKVLFLLDIGANVNQQVEGSFGITTFPLHEAVLLSSFLFNEQKKIDTFYAEQILQSLIKRGAYIASKDENGLTPLHVAAEYNNIYAAQLLLESGTKVMPKDKNGKMPLDYAKTSEMINLLKKYGAKEQP